MKRVLTPIFARLARSLGIPEVQKRIGDFGDELENRLAEATGNFASLVADSEVRVVDRLTRLVEAKKKQLTDDLDARLVELLGLIRNESQVRDLEIMQNAGESSRVMEARMANELEESLSRMAADIRREIDLLRVRTFDIGTETSGPENATLNQQARIIDDSMYVSLENSFRGDENLIKMRQSQYLPLVRNVVSNESPLLDLGCGRGEWLSLLRSENLAAEGIDSNTVSVAQCRALGLDVSHGNLLDVLQACQPGTYGAITLFQVLEHLSFSDVVTVIRLARNCLKPDGILIAEIPNLETLFVGASTFWIDPTHPRPLHPSLLRFVANQVGFRKIDGIYSTPLSPEFVFEHETAETNALKYLQSILLGNGDFALVATA